MIDGYQVILCFHLTVIGLTSSFRDDPGLRGEIKYCVLPFQSCLSSVLTPRSQRQRSRTCWIRSSVHELCSISCRDPQIIQTTRQQQVLKQKHTITVDPEQTINHLSELVQTSCRRSCQEVIIVIHQFQGRWNIQLTSLTQHKHKRPADTILPERLSHRLREPTEDELVETNSHNFHFFIQDFTTYIETILTKGRLPVWPDLQNAHRHYITHTLAWSSY